MLQDRSTRLSRFRAHVLLPSLLRYGYAGGNHRMINAPTAIRRRNAASIHLRE